MKMTFCWYHDKGDDDDDDDDDDDNDEDDDDDIITPITATTISMFIIFIISRNHKAPPSHLPFTHLRGSPPACGQSKVPGDSVPDRDSDPVPPAPAAASTTEVGGAPPPCPASRSLLGPSLRLHRPPHHHHHHHHSPHLLWTIVTIDCRRGRRGRGTSRKGVKVWAECGQ